MTATPYVLVKWSGNWADEMDLEGFKVFPTAVWDKWVEFVRENFTSYTFSVGTNEEIEYDDVEYFLRRFRPSPLTTEEAATFLKFFPSAESGFFPHPTKFRNDDEDDDTW